MIAPENPLDKGPPPGLRRMPVVINTKSQAHSIAQENEIRDKWLKHYFDDLGVLE